MSHATVREADQDHAKLLDSVRGHEGCVLHAYRDTVGALTIGWGHNLDADRALRARLLDQAGGEEGAVQITQATADRLLDNDLACAADDVWAHLPVAATLDPCRRAVLVEMAFNLGVAGLMKFRRMLAALASQDYGAAAAEMLDSKWRSDVGRRADTLAQRMKTGRWA